jgi:hypothetical protein
VLPTELRDRARELGDRYRPTPGNFAAVDMWNPSMGASRLFLRHVALFRGGIWLALGNRADGGRQGPDQPKAFRGVRSCPAGVAHANEPRSHVTGPGPVEHVKPCRGRWDQAVTLPPCLSRRPL